ncbi:MAG: hypothetical protein IPN78_03945 [Candidatus Accumulibacter sp.]|nr:hypothetical protein [Candidatus Accumulibacter propinquus]
MLKIDAWSVFDSVLERGDLGFAVLDHRRLEQSEASPSGCEPAIVR